MPYPDHLPDLLRDEEYREALAEQGYYRERQEEAAADAEHELEESAYFCMAWADISDNSKRSYRTAVAECCDNILAAITADV